MSNTNGRSDVPAEEGEPAMPVRPRPADIAMYNAWARRNGRPLWGAGAAPAPAGGPNRIRWGRRGAAAADYGQMAEEEEVDGVVGRLSTERLSGLTDPTVKRRL